MTQNHINWGIVNSMVLDGVQIVEPNGLSKTVEQLEVITAALTPLSGKCLVSGMFTFDGLADKGVAARFTKSKGSGSRPDGSPFDERMELPLKPGISKVFSETLNLVLGEGLSDFDALKIRVYRNGLTAEALIGENRIVTDIRPAIKIGAEV